MARFTQAISEGDGISLIPFLTGDVESLARTADETGAEAIAVETVAEVERVRAVSGLPILLRRRIGGEDDLAAAVAAGADAVVLGLGDFDDEDERFESLHAEALVHELDCAIEVDDDEGLALALGRVDPDILAIAKPGDDDEESFERTLDVLPDVPAGKLVISESRSIVREQVLALERAGVDAVLVGELAAAADFASALSELVGNGE